MTRRALHLSLSILLLVLACGAIFTSKRLNEESSCFSKVPVNVSDVKPPIVSGPGYPPRAGFKGITLDEAVNGSPRHVLVGFFNFEPSNWAEKRPKCYFKSLKGFSENWTGLILPGASLSNVTLSGRVYLAVYVYPLEGTAIISKVDYGETPEKSKIIEAFRLKYTEPPNEIVEAYVSKLEHSGYTAIRELSDDLLRGWVFRKGKDYILVLEVRDDGNLYLLLASGNGEDVKKLTNVLPLSGGR
ncbi:hypothetical protein [Thermococcus aciditolerans]|uniref:Uncharacterized protein n=1 Tax=Thermococcus aciditolerans TaxID=2598455 RepID=A0A5C0SJ13_9EURY|nr:hypothetical protein [Thermococcus aciditolerans]QEK14250.1 hypothetical protein FPV09_03030 [Thermococcus aciditolerans]